MDRLVPRDSSLELSRVSPIAEAKSEEESVASGIAEALRFDLA